MALLSRPGRTTVTLMLWLLGFTLWPIGARAETFRYDRWAEVLQQFVTPEGKVRYAELKANHAALDAFLAELAATSPENRPALFPTQSEQLAYWINAYNAFVVKQVVAHYPVSSVISARFLWGLTFFKRTRFVAGGREYTLDEIEHGILRRRYAEPRVHFAINCASSSCPRLEREPFLPQTLSQQLDAAARAFITSHRNVRYDAETNLLYLSKIFEWYEKEFLAYVARQSKRADASLLDYLAIYVPEEASRWRQARPRIRFLSYDWALNDAGRQP